jgi:hypothetical protein
MCESAWVSERVRVLNRQVPGAGEGKNKKGGWTVLTRLHIRAPDL